MCQNMIPKFYLRVLQGGSQELKELIIKYLPTVWGIIPAVQCNDMHVLLEQFIAESDTWDAAMVAYNRADDPVAILAVTPVCRNVYQPGLGVHIAHIFTLEKGAGAFLYKQLIKAGKKQDLSWVATYHPSYNHSSMIIRYNKL